MAQFALPPIDYEAQLSSDLPDLYSVDVGSGVRRCPRARDGLIALPLPDEPDINTLQRLLWRGTQRFAGNRCFGWRTQNRADGTWGPYEFTTFGEFGAMTRRYMGGIRRLCPWLQKQDRIGIFGKNQVHWVLAQYATYIDCLVAVPIYDTFGDEAVRYIIDHAELSVVVVSRENFPALLRAIHGLTVVRLVVVMGLDPMQWPPDLPEGCQFVTVGEVLAFDIEATTAPDVVPEDLCLLLYTSGTTGMPKGVMLTHRNLLATCAGLLNTVGAEVVEDDLYLSYLPLAHGFENAMHVAGIAKGACCGFYRGDVRVLTEDAVALRPTLFCGVPRVYQRVQQVILGRFQERTWIGRRIIAQALHDQAFYLRTGQDRSALWDFLVFRKVQAALGGRVRMFFTGAAPLSPALHEFIRVCFGCPIYEGYGLTETTAVSNCCDREDGNAGHVGAPLVSCEMRLESVPEMLYTVDDKPCPRGEVLLRGPCIMRGYYKDPAMTAAVLDPDGWFHTGDVGRFNKNGTLSIIDRKKNIFKLSQGEYIAVERLEAAFLQAPLVGQIFLYGNSYADFLVAIVVPDPIALLPQALQHGVPGAVPFRSDGWKEAFAALCRTPFAASAVLADLQAAGKAAGVKGFEIPKAVYLEGSVNDLNQAFTVENGCLTATFKLRRTVVQQRYQPQIDAMYAALTDAPATHTVAVGS